LRDKVDFRPGEAKFKVYIIDEVHMLSTAAFNALLKTLEEPPPHVIFVLATTDPQKIPATVISRVQRFDFRRLTLAEITARLREIAAKENLDVEPAAIDLIAHQATGAMRDAISLLDQLTAFGSDKITLVQVQGLLGASSSQLVGEMIGRLGDKDVTQGLALIASAVDHGADPRQLAREIIEYLRGLLLMKTKSAGALSLTAETQAEMAENVEKFTADQLVHAIRLFNQAGFELRTSVHPTLPLEIALVESTLAPAEATAGSSSVGTRIRHSAPPPTGRTPSAPPPIEPKRGAPNIQPHPKEDLAVAHADEKVETGPAAPSNEDLLSVEALSANWGRVLQSVKKHNKIAEALLRDAEPIKIEGEQVVLGFHHQLHAERFEKDAKGIAVIEKVIGEVMQKRCRVKCVLSPKRARLIAVENDPLIQAAVDQMGAQVTEIHESEG
jgi:DNA polymerase III subunit gamma/tau